MSEPNTSASGQNSSGVQQIRITLWHNLAMRDWSVVINGQCHEHVTIEVMEALVESELIVAESALTHQQDG
jgi:hypothetical protein